MAIDTRPFSIDPLTNRVQLFHYDDATDEVTIETITDVEDILEQNKALFNERDARYGEAFGNAHVASVPIEIWQTWKREGRVDNERDLKKVLNDPDNRMFRTKPGRI